MDEWRKLALLLCIYGVLKEFRPLEPYITRFFSEPPMNFTTDQINVEIYPISVYSNLLTLIVIFLVTDLLRYKPIIILNSLTGITLYVVLLICRSIFAIQVVEVLYGLYISCEVAYYTYIYAKVDSSHYQEVTGFTRAAYLTGRALSGIASQTLIACGLHLMTLAQISFGVLIVSFLWAISLPSVENSIYFHRSADLESPDYTRNSNKIKVGFKLLFDDFIAAFSQADVRKYIFWWAACNGGYLQVLQFVQVLWEETSDNPKDELVYNGGVEAICTFMGAIGAFSFGQWKADWNLYGELILCLGALVLGGVLILMASTNKMIVAYITYIAFSVGYNAVVTIAKSQIAFLIKPDSTGLIFGITLFLALLLQTTITLILVQYLQFSAKLQFSLYGYYYVLIGILFGIKWTFTYFTRQRGTQMASEQNTERNYNQKSHVLEVPGNEIVS